jgi:hypothetical protein
VQKWERALCEMNEQQDTVLSLALRRDNLAVVSLLLELGAARSVFVHAYRSDVLVCTLPFKTTPPAAIGHASTATEQLAGRSPTPSSHSSKLLALLDQRLESYITDLAAGARIRHTYSGSEDARYVGYVVVLRLQVLQALCPLPGGSTTTRNRFLIWLPA